MFTVTKDIKFILASASPRRRDLLRLIGISDFETIPAQYEEPAPAGVPPNEAVCAIALGKARQAAASTPPGSLILAADTLVYLDGEALGKPRDKADAARMLGRLSDRRHTVYTGVAIIRDARELCSAVATDVFFREISPGEISAYIEGGEPMDKAGAYGAQGYGAVFIERVEGDFYNVVGLPLCRLSEMLLEMGVELH